MRPRSTTATDCPLFAQQIRRCQPGDPSADNQSVHLQIRIEFGKRGSGGAVDPERTCIHTALSRLLRKSDAVFVFHVHALYRQRRYSAMKMSAHAAPTREVFAAEVPQTRSLSKLRAAAKNCEACPLYRNATQTVFGEGPRKGAHRPDAIARLEELQFHEGVARARRLAWIVHANASRNGDAEIAAREAIDAARLAGDTVMERRFLSSLAFAGYTARPASRTPSPGASKS